MTTPKLQQSRPRAIVLAPTFSTAMNANRAMTAACVMARFADVQVVTSDFDHWTKEKRTPAQCAPIANIVYLPTMPYYSNIGLSRLLSHFFFSIRAWVYFLRRRAHFDIVYVTLPFNTLAWLALGSARGKWKIADITDIWPDVLPFSERHWQLGRPLFKIWKAMFKRAVTSADTVMAVSDAFFEEAQKHVRPQCVGRRFYLGEVGLHRDVPKNETLTIVYIGNIGRLYDFETLLEALGGIKSCTVQLFVIGEGDRREWLISQLSRRGIAHKYFGSVYDPEVLGDILCRAHIGFNGFVNTTATFSTKASTYFSAGLPILNSMRGDLAHLVLKHSLGFNYQGGDTSSLRNALAKMMTGDKLRVMSENCLRFFSEELERNRVRDDMHAFLSARMTESSFDHGAFPDPPKSNATRQ